MVSELDSESGGPGSRALDGPGCVVFLGKTFYSHSTSLLPGLRSMNGYRLTESKILMRE